MGGDSGAPRKHPTAEASEVVGADVREAVREWAKGVRGAPFRFEDMVILLKGEEEVLIRVATEIQRRDVVWLRRPAEPGRRPTDQGIDPRTVDPWEISPDDLRAATEEVEPCATCGGRGASGCSACGGTRATRCGTCGGSGRVAGAAAPCSACRGSGGVPCGSCGGQGAMGCGACRGSGVMVVCLTYEQVTRVDVRIAPDGPLVASHPQLREPRILAKSDLASFTVLAAAMASGAVPSAALSYDEYERLLENAPLIDRRVERVSQQQYLRVASVRRELAYEMCGARGKLVLSGAKYVVEATPESLLPIQRRARMWALGAIVIVLATVVAGFLLAGPTAYFRRSNQIVAATLAAGAVAAVGVLGGVLRAWGTRLRLSRLMLSEKVSALVPFLAVAVVVLVKSQERPTAAEAREALAAGNLPRVAVILEALDATRREQGEVAAVRDEIAYADALKLTGDLRLARLDAIAAQAGTRAPEAAREAREERVRRVRALLEEHKLDAALLMIDKVFPDREKDHLEAGELRAAVHDLEFEQCVTDPCRFVAARKSERDMATSARASRVKDVQRKMTAALSTTDLPGESTLARLQRLRALETTAQAIAGVVSADDPELKDRAKSAGEFAAREREKVPLLGADQATSEELLGHLDEKLHASIEGIAVYLSMDQSKRCSGVYVVGETEAGRKEGLKSEYLPTLILTKALGRAAALRRPAKDAPDPTTSSWSEGSVPVVSRWRDGTFAEMRIGDATLPLPSPPKAHTLGPGKLPIVSVVAFPGGQIFVDGVSQGRDATPPLRLKIGRHDVTVKNRYLGEGAESIEVKDEGPKPRIVTVVW